MGVGFSAPRRETDGEDEGGAEPGLEAWTTALRRWRSHTALRDCPPPDRPRRSWQTRRRHRSAAVRCLQLLGWGVGGVLQPGEMRHSRTCRCHSRGSFHRRCFAQHRGEDVRAGRPAWPDTRSPSCALRPSPSGPLAKHLARGPFPPTHLAARRARRKSHGGGLAGSRVWPAPPATWFEVISRWLRSDRSSACGMDRTADSSLFLGN